MFELLIRALKRIPRPLLPLVPMLVMLLGPALVLLLIVHLVPEAPGDDVGRTWAVRNVARSPASGAQTRRVDQPSAGAISKTSSQAVN